MILLMRYMTRLLGENVQQRLTYPNNKEEKKQLVFQQCKML